MKWCHGQHLESIYNTISEIRLHWSMHTYLKNNPAKFHPDPLWNDEALDFFEEVTPTRRRTRQVAVVNQ